MTTRTDIDAIARGRPQRLDVLDSVRGVAAAVVVVHHCLLTMPAFSDFFFSTWAVAPSTPFQFALFATPLRLAWDGYEAVTLFYVLSGLVLALPWIENRPPPYPVFVIKRVCRIYLPYLAAIALAATLDRLLTLRAPIPGLSAWVNEMNWSHPVTAWMLLDHLLMVGHNNNINGVIHSLIWEMRVSLLFPLLVVPVVRWRLRGAAAVAGVILGIIAAIQVAHHGGAAGLTLMEGVGLHGPGKVLFEVQWTAYYALFFVVGTLIALHLPSLRRMLAAWPGWARGACLLAGLLIIQGHWTRVHVGQEMMVALGSALVIVAALSPGLIERVLLLRPLRWLGKVSYSLYLVHVPLILAAVLVLHDVLPHAVILCGAAFAALPVAWAFHVLVAEPSVRLGQRLAGRRAGSGRRAGRPVAALPG